MKKSFLFVVLIAAVTPAVFAQKADIAWEKKTIDNGIKHPIWYPKISNCPAERKINAWLNQHPEWSDYNYEGIDSKSKELYGATAKIAIEQNGGKYLILYRVASWHNSHTARENENYVRFNLKTGRVQEKNVNYDGVNTDESW